MALTRTIHEPSNPVLNVSRREGRPHSPSVRIGDYVRQLASLPLKANIVVLDAARQQPFVEGQIASGLALVEADPHMLIAFSAAPGTVAPAEQGPYGAYAQSLAEMIQKSLREEITKSTKASIGFLLSKSAFRSFKTRIDYSEYGGAPLLGVKKCCIVGHGRSSAKAIKNAIRLAAEFSRKRLAERIQESIAELHSREKSAQVL